MKFYLDDNLAGRKLETLLANAKHVVVRPQQANLAGATDPAHLTYAIGAGLVSLTRDWEDFEDLHKLIAAAGGHHPGIVAVRFDNDRRHDMKPKDIVKALGKLDRSGMVMLNEYVILNHWR
ncbi:MAG TPA: DUF5615 family PIN-like protein [Gemmataceae bacterium]|nr:DUF5615 family PIN-like protein [Gemmataceae bacterium]